MVLAVFEPAPDRGPVHLGLIVLCHQLLCTFGLWLIPRTWGLGLGVILGLGLTAAGVCIAGMLLMPWVVDGDMGWWARILQASPLLTVPGLLWLAHRPMGHIGAMAHRAC